MPLHSTHLREWWKLTAGDLEGTYRCKLALGHPCSAWTKGRAKGVPWAVPSELGPQSCLQRRSEEAWEPDPWAAHHPQSVQGTRGEGEPPALPACHLGWTEETTDRALSTIKQVVRPRARGGNESQDPRAGGRARQAAALRTHRYLVQALLAWLKGQMR